jgi:hypothetical protein
VLLVHDDEAEREDRGEDRRAGADDDRCLAGGDALAFVATLGIRQRGVQDGDPLPEAGTEAAERLRGERDLGNEDDGPASALEGRGASLQIHLGLPAARRTVQQDMSAAGVQSGDDPIDCCALRGGERSGLRLARKRLAMRRRASFPAPGALTWSDESQRSRGRRSVVVGKPEGELDELRRDPIDDRSCTLDLDPGRAPDAGLHDDPAHGSRTEGSRDDVSSRELFVDLVRERARKRTGRDERIDRRERHAPRLDG